MPYALVTIGLLMIVTGINNTYSQFARQLQTDFGGSKGFIVWAIALAAVGALGYIKDLRQFSHYFMALILISFVLSNKGVFQNFTAALNKGPSQPQASPEPGSAAASNDVNSNQNAPTSGQGTFGGSTFKESLGKQGGGGFWDFFNIPSWARPSWAQ